MKQITKFVCDLCATEYNSAEKALACENLPTDTPSRQVEDLVVSPDGVVGVVLEIQYKVDYGLVRLGITSRSQVVVREYPVYTKTYPAQGVCTLAYIQEALQK